MNMKKGAFTGAEKENTRKHREFRWAGLRLASSPSPLNSDVRQRQCITSVLLMLFAEAALLQSLPIALWMLVFFIAHAIYFPLSEEKGLKKRFGDDYREYCAHVPRWIPKLRPWKPDNRA